MAKLPFSVFKRNGRRFYSVAFKNEATGKYLPAISTKQETEAGAIATAFQWQKDGIPRKSEMVPVKKYTLRDMAKEADVSVADCEFICKELQRRGLLQSYVLSETKQAIPFTDFLLNFWDFDNSAYVREKLRKNHGIHRNYCRGQVLIVEKYWVPFFAGRLMGELTKADIEAFIDNLDNEKRKLSAGRKNGIVKAGSIPLRWAFHKEMINRDITAGITMFSGKVAEREILTPELAAAVFKTQWVDERTRLANMLAAVSGMRAGEIQGLRIQDLGRDCLYIRHSWNFRDGLKTTKTNETRTVEVFPELIAELVNLAKNNPHGVSMESYVFWGELKADKPIEEKILIRDLRVALVKIGMDTETAKNYVFHGWRHYFTAYMRERITDKLLQSQTGHKSLSMIAHYSEHRIAGDRERIQAAQRAVFGGLLPDTTTNYIMTAGA
jgi:integrase